MKSFEFWHPRVAEAPYYAYLLAQCLKLGLPPLHLAKANYALDHGELGLGSKFDTQFKFDQRYFLATELLEPNTPVDELREKVEQFAQQHGFPVILKPDIGAVGKGIRKIRDAQDIEQAVTTLQGDHLLQAYTDHPTEFGVFYVRRMDTPQITGINQKHFPSVIGNGRSTLKQLAEQHERYTQHWQMFLRYLDLSYVPASKETVRLSFVGSHTMGCKFTDDTAQLTPAIKKTINEICDTQPGFNFGRLDVKAASEAAFRDGEFVVIEVNGIASLPTHMFDPTNSIRRAYEIFFAHARHLAHTAQEHRQENMDLDSLTDIWRKAKSNYGQLNEIHERVLRN